MELEGDVFPAIGFGVSVMEEVVVMAVSEDELVGIDFSDLGEDAVEDFDLLGLGSSVGFVESVVGDDG